MIKIEWIEIPPGESLFGLSAEQKNILRRRVREHYKYTDLDEQMRQQIEALLAKFADFATQPKKNPLSIPKLSRQEDAIVQRFAQLFQVEADLRREHERAAVLERFYISRFPITQEQWLEKFGRAPFEEQPLLPAPSNWETAVRFSKELGGRLPTAAEWEKAARGPEGWLYPWGNEWDASRGNFIRDPQAPGHVSGTWMTPVDTYPSGASPYGVWDMCGNIQEWTMTTKKLLTSSQEEQIVKKAWPVKFDSDTPWYDHILLGCSLARPEDAFYTGFRPIRDRWQPQQWQGAAVEKE